MVRRPIEDDDDNPERWLVSYADFITLLFAFFVVMYSVSSVNQGKYKELSSSINVAFSNTKPTTENETPASATESAEVKPEQVVEPPLPSSAPTQAEQKEVESMSGLAKQLAQSLLPLIKEGKARVIQNNRGIRIDIKDSVMFTEGSADLVVTAKAVLTEIAAPLLISKHAILVEGHTDDTPIHIQNAAFFSNWELSAVRASSIVGMLNEVGIENLRLSALGYGPSQPIANNSSEEGRATNRHISIMILYDSLTMDGQDGIEIKPE